MANPAPTNRGTPTGIMIPDGFRTKVTLALIPTLEVEEVEVKVSGFDGGEPIEQDSMWMERLRVVRARQTLDCTPLTFVCKYDPSVLNTLKGQINVEKSGSTAQVITETYYDGTQRAWFGYVRAAEPENIVANQKGRMTITCQPTNWDPVNHVYAEPQTVSVAGS